MTRETIEEKDQLLIKKIREIVHSKKNKTDKGKPGRQFYTFGLSVFCVGLIIASLMIFRQAPGVNVAENPEPNVVEVVEKKDDVVAVTETKVAETTREAPPEETSLPDKEQGKTDVETSAVIPDPEPSIVMRGEEPAHSEPVENKVNSSGIQISEMVACISIDGRQYVSPQTVFSLKDNPKSYVWMNVLSENQPFSLTHVYYINGKKYCEVPLQVHYPRMRTWSNVTLTRPEHIGTWRVDVITENGERIGQTWFDVVQ